MLAASFMGAKVVKLASTNQKPGSACDTPGATWKVLAPMPSHDTTHGKPWDPDPYGTEAFEMWEEYRRHVDTYHAQWVDADPTRKSGYVYIMEMIPSRLNEREPIWLIKIGMSRNPNQRLKEVSKSNVVMPYSIRLVKTIWSSDMARAERLLHLLMQRYRVDGEWFSLPIDIAHALDSIWYIAPYHTLTDLEFRDEFHGGWYFPQAFFEYQLSRYEGERSTLGGDS